MLYEMPTVDVQSSAEPTDRDPFHISLAYGLTLLTLGRPRL